MYLEIPEFRRCCCCLPLRCGIIVFGYINLVISILIIVLEVISLWNIENADLSRTVFTMYNGAGMLVQCWAAILLFAVDIIFIVILLLGGHKKDIRLLKVYFYYGIATCFATLIVFIIMSSKDRKMENSMLFYVMVVETTFTITVIGIKIYLLLLIRSELKKLKQKSGLRFASKASEEEGINPF